MQWVSLLTLVTSLATPSYANATPQPVKRAAAPYYTALGCYKDFYPSFRALSQASTSSGGMTIPHCAIFCNGKGAAYFGVEYAKECYCGSLSDAGALQTSTGCTMACAGKSDTTCGGNNALNVFVLGYANSSSSATTSTRAASTTMVSTASSSTSVTMTASFANLGCFKDYYPNKVRALNAASTSSSAMTAQLCSTFCGSIGAAYFGTEYSFECYCGSTSDFNALTTASACTMPCSGNAQEICGGDNQINVYGVPVVAAQTSTLAVSPTQTTLAVTATTKTAGAFPSAYANLGCFKDFYPNKVRALNAAVTSSSAMTAKLCSTFCSNLGLPYFGTEYASECYCGTNADFAALQSSAGCSMTCKGNSQEICGGDNRINVYGYAAAAPSMAASFTLVISASVSVSTVASTLVMNSSAPVSTVASTLVVSSSASVLAVDVASSTSASTTLISSGTPTLTSTTTSTSPVTFSALGCVQDFYPNKVRALNAAFTTSAAMTANVCFAFCSSQGTSFFATEYARECYCGSNQEASKFQFTSGCTMPCTGNTAEICGGDNKASLYMLSGGNYSVPAVPTSTVQSTTVSASAAFTFAPVPTFAANDSTPYVPYGCYADFSPSRRALNGGSVSSKAMTQEYCSKYCAFQASAFFGVEYGQECWCSGQSDELSALQPSTACNMACAGNATQNCGGPNALQVFVNNPQYFGPSPAPPPTNTTLAFPYGSSTKVRGVNLGGWLVLEPFIKPSLFQQFLTGPSAVDEYTFCKVLGYTEAQRQLKQHWDTWYTEADFAKFKASGLNHVRIPIGYWAFLKLDSEPFVTGQDAYLDKALVWAANNGLVVWIDLHGGLGSQNGFDNSGRYGPIGWGSDETVQNTLDVLQIITDRYGTHPTVAGIELLNEPAGFSIDAGVIQNFNRRGYQITKSGSRLTIMQDAFQPYSNIYNSFKRPTFSQVAVDIHIYHIFSAYENSLTHAQKLNLACNPAGDFGSLPGKIYGIVGEWSAAENDCAMWLNGFKRGARYDGTLGGNAPYGSCAGQNQLADMSDQKKSEVRDYILAQLDKYETTDGWIFWAGKTETADMWNFQKLFDAGLFPIGVRGFCSGSV